MALNKDLSALPMPVRDGGEPPDPNPRFGPVVAAAWESTVVRDKPHALPESRFRHSDAAMCAAYLGYQLRGEARSNPLTIADFWRFGVGNSVHDMWQAHMVETFERHGWTVSVEVPCSIDPDLSGHADLLLVMGYPDGSSHRVVIELKSINGYGYKQSIGERGDPEGPRHSAKIQGALNAEALDADELVICYLALELVSPALAKRAGLSEIGRFTAEWTYPRAEFLPWAEAERGRVRELFRLVDGGEMPPRIIPDPEIPVGAQVVDPSTGRWEVHEEDGNTGRVFVTASGRTWHCGYCGFQNKCLSDIS